MSEMMSKNKPICKIILVGLPIPIKKHSVFQGIPTGGGDSHTNRGGDAHRTS